MEKDRVSLSIRSMELFQESGRLKVLNQADLESAEKLMVEIQESKKACKELKPEEQDSAKKSLLYFQNAENGIKQKMESYLYLKQQDALKQKEFERLKEESRKRVESHQKFMSERANAKTEEHLVHDVKAAERKESIEVSVTHRKQGRPKGSKNKVVA